MKFRELVNKLNEQIADHGESRPTSEDQHQLNLDICKDKSGIVEPSIDFKQMFAESRAYTRAIDLQLRQIELSQATEHVQMLISFMPSTFMNRGGDHDAILAILLASRIILKTDIIIGQARERFPATTQIDMSSLVQGHAVQQFTFKSRLLHHVFNLKSIMHQFLFSLNSCSPELFLKVGESLPELLSQEKIVDNFIDLVKGNKLDENSTTDSLEKAVVFFNAIYSVLFSNDCRLLNGSQLIGDAMSSIQPACDSVAADNTILQTLIAGETSDLSLLLQFISQSIESIRQQMKLVKRRLPQGSSMKFDLSEKMVACIRQTNEQLGKIMIILSITSKSVLHSLSSKVTDNNDDNVPVKIHGGQIEEKLADVCEKIYEQDYRGHIQNIKSALGTISENMVKLAQFLVDNEYDIIQGSNKKDMVSPVILRSQYIKTQMEETKALKATVENREADIKQMKIEAKIKQQELSEMQYRRDLADKKVAVLQQEFAANIEKLQRQRDEVNEKLKQ